MFPSLFHHKKCHKRPSMYYLYVLFVFISMEQIQKGRCWSKDKCILNSHRRVPNYFEVEATKFLPATHEDASSPYPLRDEDNEVKGPWRRWQHAMKSKEIKVRHSVKIQLARRLGGSVV